MAKNGSPLGFATVGNTTVSSFFAFITGATTVSGLFLGLFGLTAFGYVLIPDNNITIWTVLSSLSMLPNPLQFIKDCTQIVNAVGEVVKTMKSATAGSGSQIIDWLINIASGIVTIGSYVLMLAVAIILLPVYIVFFFLRCGAVALTALGFDWDVLNILKLEWSPVQTIVDLLKGIKL